MKRLKIIFISILILLFIITAHSCSLSYFENTDNELKATNIGIGGGGMLHSPSISHFDSNTIIIASDMGGLYVSNNSGENWSRKNLKGTVITTYADPHRADVLYAGGSGLWRSTDNGKTFEMIFPREDDLIDRVNNNENGLHYLFTKSKVYPTNKYVKNILVNPNNPDNIFVLSYYGKEGIISESTDNGETFNRLFSFKQTKSDLNIFYELAKLAYNKETNELFCINDEEVLKYDREKNEVISVYQSELGMIDAVQVFENDKTQFIIIEKTDELANCETKVFYTNDFENITDITEKIIKDQLTEFNYNNETIEFKWKFNHIDATSLNNIYITHNNSAPNYPWLTNAILRFDGEKSTYRYGNPFRNHNNIINKGWSDGNTSSYGIAVSTQKPEMCIQTTLTGVNYFPNDTEIYQRSTTTIKDENGTRYVTNGIDEQTTYGVRFDPFSENHMLLLNTDLGLISSTDNGESWVRTNSGIKSTWVNTIYDAEFDKNKEGVVYSIWGGRHDAPYNATNETDNTNVHGGFAISLDGGKSWDCNYSNGIPENTTPIKMAVVYNDTEDVTIYVATFKHGFFVSTDSGKTFTEINDGIEKVSYKEGEEYQYILASDIEAKDGKVFGITARSRFQNSTQKGEVFELIDNKWQKIDLATDEVGKNVITPRDIYYYDGTLYISSTCNAIYNYKNGKDFSNYGGGIITYKDGKISQIFDESISTTGVQIDSKGNLYVSDINGNIYRRAYNSEEYLKVYDSYHSISKGIQLIDDDVIYLSSLGGGVLKLEGLKSLMTSEEETVLGDIDLDGKVTINDLAVLKLHLIEKQTITDENRLKAADIDKDGKLTINDLAILKLHLIGLSDIDNKEEITVKDTSFKGLSFEQITPLNGNVTFERLNFQSAKQKEYDIYGAGSQWPVSLETSNDGSLMLYGIDVAGMYKSTDHGKTWTPANSGIGARGVNMFAIDPYNSNHVLALGLAGNNVGGIYVSYDKAETWKKDSSEVLTCNGARYLWDGLEFDPTSYDAEKNLTMDAYYSTPYMRDTDTRHSLTTVLQSQTKLTEEQAGLYKSIDGGESFNIVINDKRLADGIIRFTDNGELYIGNQYGLFLIDKEKNEIKKSYLENADPVNDFAKGVTGLDVVGNTIYVQTWDGIFTIIDGGEPEKITNENYMSNNWPQYVTVSKSNPNHIIYQYRSNVNNYYVNRIVVSLDGGKTWTMAQANIDTTFYKAQWSAREKLFIIDPSDDNNVITFGSDTLMRSNDGGLNFVQASGVSNMMQGGKFNFNYYDPDLIMFSAQDYTGVVSFDGGETFEKLTVPDKGNMYGGFAADRKTYFGFSSPTWGGGTLTVTHDAGDTWIDTGLKSTDASGSTYYSSLQSPNNPDILFAAEYYSKDHGYTWNKMNGCVSVFTFNYTGQKELYGTNKEGKVVVSYDDGDTWEIILNKPWKESENTISEHIFDLAYDHVNNYIYAVVSVDVKGSGDKVNTAESIYKLDINKKEFKKLDIPVDNIRGYMRQKTVAVDPNSTNVVYVGGNGAYFSSATSLLRSVDGGETWNVLTSNNEEKYPSIANNSGGYEVANIRVNPYDGKLWIACGCYGYETINPPYDASKLNHAKPEEHTIKYVYNDKVVHEEKVKNNEIHNYVYDEDGITLVSWYTDKEFTNEFPNGSRVYNSMVLYAKMEESVKVKFYDRNTLLREIDLDAYDAGSQEQIPIREGYAFAGWYKNEELTELVNFKEIEENTSVYAGWYEIVEDIFDIDAKDIGNYIAYSDQRIQDGKEVENDVQVDNRCVYATIDKNSTYYISFRMDTRCRIGLGQTAFWQYNAVKEYFIDEDDNNGRVPANKYVFKTIESGNNNKLLVYYYTESGSKEFMDIKKTFKIYKIKNTNVQENNFVEKIS